MIVEHTTTKRNPKKKSI